MPRGGARGGDHALRHEPVVRPRALGDALRARAPPQAARFVRAPDQARPRPPPARAPHRARRGLAGGLRFSYRHEYTAEAFSRQLEGSLQRHGLGRVDSAVIHDLEPGAAGGGFADGRRPRAPARARQHARACRDGGFALLGARRAAGELGAIGAGVNAPEQGEDAAAKWAWNREFVGELLSWRADADGRGIDFLLLANTYSLLEHGGLELFDACATAGVAVVVGGPSSGIPVTGADPPDAATNPPRFNYQPAPARVRERHAS